MIQYEGARALQSAKLVEVLGLTDAQKSKLASLEEERSTAVQNAMTSAMSNAGGGQVVQEAGRWWSWISTNA